MLENNRFLVLGSNCFSGANFVRYLVDNSIEVMGMSRSEQPHPAFMPHTKSSNSHLFQFHQFDINNQLDEMMIKIEEFKPAYVVNFIAQGMVGQSWNHPEHWMTTNVVSTVQLHDRLRHCDFMKKYVHASTPEVYGNQTGILKESLHYLPSTPYAVSQAAADMSLMSFYHAYDFPVVFTRSANVYGAGQQLYRIIPRTILYLLLGKKLQLHGGGTSVRSFIHIDDVSDATYKAALSAPSGDIFHLSSPPNLSIYSLVEKIAHKLGKSMDECVEVVGDRLGKDSEYILDSQKAQNELYWEPKISLDDGIDSTINWVTENLEILKEHSFDYVHKI